MLIFSKLSVGSPSLPPKPTFTKQPLIYLILYFTHVDSCSLFHIAPYSSTLALSLIPHSLIPYFTPSHFSIHCLCLFPPLILLGVLDDWLYGMVGPCRASDPHTSKQKGRVDGYHRPSYCCNEPRPRVKGRIRQIT